jgi:ABC-type uncharacterized transport system ATPase subunit
MNADPALIRLEKICKSFGSLRANSDISLDIHAGRIKALLGENGAGKSTLMSILSGRLQPDAGRIVLGGRPVLGYNTRDAIAAGIGMVYQHFMLVEAMTVAENVFLGQEGGFFVNPRQMVQKVGELAAAYGLGIDPAAKVAQLSMGERQRVEILKLLYRQSQVLIFDEPTAVLTPPETEQLFAAFRQMARQGKAIVFISHKLAEVMDVADEITILRKGCVVEHLAAGQVNSQAELARRMVGREMILQVEKETMEPLQRVLRVEHLSDSVLKNVSMDLRQGEILALVGVAGNGQKQLVETVCGLRRPETGQVTVLGTPWERYFSGKTQAAVMSYVPEDRLGLATCRGLNLVDNFLLTTRGSFTQGPWLLKKKAECKAKDLIRDFDIQPPNPQILARNLSGGNLQKMVLAREFFRSPRLIVAEQPTQGLDIRAAEEVWQLLLSARVRAGILLITGDLNEALALSDRIGVMYAGRIVDIFDTGDTEKVDQIGSMMAGLI